MAFNYDAFRTRLLLREFPNGLSTASLSQFLGLPFGTQNSLLHDMVEFGIVERGEEQSHWRLAASFPNREQDGRFKKYCPREDDLPGRSLVLLADSRVFEGCVLLQTLLQRLIVASHLGGAAICLELLVRRLLDCQYESMSAHEQRQYVSVILMAQSDAFSLGVCMIEARGLSERAHCAAKMLGDQRALALINLVGGCLENLSGVEDPTSLNSLLEQGLNAIKVLDDADMEGQVSYYLSFLYYERGDFRACYSAFDLAHNGPQVLNCLYFNKMYPLYMSPAASRLCQYAQSIGICQSALHEAQTRGDRHKILWMNVLLAIHFLQEGITELGLEHLSAVIDCVDVESSPKLYLWVWRALALHHARSGRLEASHRIITECMHLRFRIGVGRFAYTSIWVLELLASYESQGLPPIPGYRLDEEIESVFGRQNRHLHGMAFRLKAMRLAGDDVESKVRLLRSSHEAFLGCGDRREAARSALLLVPLLKRCGRLAEAENLEVASQADFASTTVQPASAFVHLTPWQGYVFPASVADSLESCFNLIENIESVLPVEAQIGALLNAVQREMGAERAVLCRLLPDGNAAYVVGCNIQAQEFESRAYASGLQELVYPGTPDWLLSCSQDRVSLRLRVSNYGEGTHGFFMESTHIAGAFVFMDAEAQKRLHRALERELKILSRMNMVRQRNLQEMGDIEFSMPYDSSMKYHDGAGFRRTLEQARHAAASDAAILILGETGVGKEVLARRIHEFSGRTGAFIPVHPASTPENLFESEFFGHEKGAFTGADRQKPGLFELANKGTFFIDELAEIPLSFQIKLLRVLQEHTFMRVGGTRSIQSDFRLIAATNKNLWDEVQKGRFREDLYYRVSVIPITIPPLRERQDDIPGLLNLFIKQFGTRYGRYFQPLDQTVVEKCRRYPWHGNIREMKNVVERAVILNTGGPLELLLLDQHRKDSPPEGCSEFETFYTDLPTLEELTVRYMTHVLKVTQGKVIGLGGAEQILGVKRSTLYAKLRKYGLKKSGYPHN
jgi:DNA-binding NtrC family response regulator/tetratricopeptide (TPR) repeat protein